MKNKKINLVVFGAGGDLATNYIYPALLRLWDKKYRFNLYGYGRSKLTQEEFRKKITEKSVNKEINLKSFYFSGNYDAEGIAQIKGKIKYRTNIFYLAIPTNEQLITSILDGLKRNNLINKNSKLILEKPFGLNKNCSKRLISKIRKYINPKIVYPVDHYLTKDLVKSLYELRFNNVILKEVWNKKLIKRIEIIAIEDEKINNRGDYYDQVGAIKDMVQNHLLQLLALITMDKPKKYNQKYFSKSKLAIINKIKLLKDSKNIVGQYRGYKQEKGINKKSKTETLVKLFLQIDKRKWKNIPIKMVTGKAMTTKKTEIRIVFDNNELVINLAPENEIRIIDNNFANRTSFRFNCKEERGECNLAYENLLKEIIDGRKINIPTFEEILAQWKITEKILKETKKLKLWIYRPGISLKD